MSTATINQSLLEIQRKMPNIVGMAGVGVLAMVGSIVGLGSTQAADSILKASNKLSENLDKRNESLDEAITELEELNIKRETETKKKQEVRADKKLEGAKEQDPIKQKIAELQGQLDLTEEKTAGKVQVTQAKVEGELNLSKENTSGQVQVIEEKGKLDIKESKQSTAYEQKEMKVDHKTNMVKLLDKHYGVMATKTEELGKTAGEAKKSADAYTKTATSTHSVVAKLNLSIAKSIDAHAKLNGLLDKIDTQKLKGEVTEVKAEAVQEAIINVIKTEAAIDTQITVSNIDSKSELRQSIAKEFSAESNKLDSWLATQTKETLSTLGEACRTEIKTENEAMLKPFIEKLESMKTEALSQEKAEEHGFSPS